MSDDDTTNDHPPANQLSKQDIIEKLSGECMEADWNMLQEHYKRGALVVVSKDLDLIDVGASIAKDEVENLQSWMKQGFVHQATPKEAGKWEKDPYKKSFRFIIVQPYVLIQRV